jgi:hypothetical protein
LNEIASLGICKGNLPKRMTIRARGDEILLCEKSENHIFSLYLFLGPFLLEFLVFCSIGKHSTGIDFGFCKPRPCNDQSLSKMRREKLKIGRLSKFGETPSTE